ncbi:MFS general substrate transporter [Karstenula rhodostoma CBS 690.94]|uniref:MFS general substrate transporter n=1 Tax=Karstenula rhodostoma CBS 690.94 TaxID=1392251 RepID=A0A9P4U8P9_9PLEO|nr:MFS general substrate transporter [Karstenula rhodostoma CBS 690.94]
MAFEKPEAAVNSAAEPQLAPGSPSTFLNGWRLGVVITSLFLGTFLIALDTNIVGVAIPKISTEFNALQDISWYGSAYLLTITAFQPMLGSFYRFFSVEGTYKGCIVVFESSSEMFIVGRAIAGLGAAGILQGALSIIGYAVELKDRPLYMGIVVSVFVVSTCMGPVLGGVFTDRTTWRWCFWINLPIGAVVLVILQLFLRIRGTDNPNRNLSLRNKMKHMDPVGCLFFIAAVVCLLLAFQWGGQSRPWNSSTIIGLFVGAGLLTIVFVYLQIKLGDKATIPPRVLKQRSILTGGGVLFFLGAACYVDSFYIPFWFQSVQGRDALAAGVRMIAFAVPQIVALIVAGAVVTKTGHYVPLIIVGGLVSIAGTALLTKLQPHTPTANWAAYMVVASIGQGTAMQLPYTAVGVVLSADDIPIGNAISVFVWQLGGAIAIAVGQTITLTTIITEVPKRIPEVSPQAVIAAGALGFDTLAATPDALVQLRDIWNLAFTRTMILSLAMTCAAVPCALGMEFLNSRKIAEQRMADAQGEE